MALNESGRNEIYLIPFQHGQDRWRVSTQGGTDVAWGRDGWTLYYTSGQDDMWAVRVMTRGETVELGTPQHVFNTPIRINVKRWLRCDARRPVLDQYPGEPADVSMILVQNWKSLLNQ